MVLVAAVVAGMLAVVLVVSVRMFGVYQEPRRVVEEDSLQAVEGSQRALADTQEDGLVDILREVEEGVVEEVVVGWVQAVLVRALGLRRATARCWRRRG